MKIEKLQGSSDVLLAQDSDPGVRHPSIRTKVCECVESVLGALKKGKSENAQNRILAVPF